ncbi:GNAT family N-acetyltransferase [Massilia sp. YIM B02443]|uniref:GNAT family N-acetyltransferase n=1 Tax=Massilia sp. YIM B02443 TaxID=3050127 RepID=UPI0025B7305A|nr:GNAT family N-acetyltransferase [Massilia sp. YIM B02443]
MTGQFESAQASPELLWGWLAARSVARGLPLPVPAHGGMRVDTGRPDEASRHVFAGPDPRIGELAAAIRTPRHFIKMCGPGERLLSLAPAGWELQPRAYLMTQDVFRQPPLALDPAYRLALARQGGAIAVSIHADDGRIAASGYAAEHGGAFVFDRIAVDPGHRRRGLGRALMAALGAEQRSPQATRVLVASDDGRALYSTLGWSVRCAYSTIVIPG